MNGELSLIQYEEKNDITIKCLQDRVAIWIFGFIFLEQEVTTQELHESLKTAENENIDVSINLLVKAGYIREEQGVFTPTEEASKFAKVLNVSRQTSSSITRSEISIDLFIIDNMAISSATKASKQAIISELVNNPRLYSVPGLRYGFVDCRCLNDEIIFGYLTQEYTAHFIDYDDSITRHDEWPSKFLNTLFIWPINTQMYILQDTRFPSTTSLNMTQTKSRITMLMQLLGDHCGINRSGDMVLRPYEREMLKDEMVEILLNSSQVVTETGIDLGNITSHIGEKLPVFNPREDWNVALTEIINEYELPNVAKATFRSTKMGTLGHSKFVKALALAGRLKTITLGRGKDTKIIKSVVPTHVGRVEISDPISNEDVTNVLSFLQEKLALNFGTMSLESKSYSTQMRFEI